MRAALFQRFRCALSKLGTMGKRPKSSFAQNDVAQLTALSSPRFSKQGKSPTLSEQLSAANDFESTVYF
ncbi:unnamed protein product, partial [Mesorhabditis spiculigera]